MPANTHAIKGAAALMEALDLIGKPEVTDYELAKVIVDNEANLRELIVETFKTVSF